MLGFENLAEVVLGEHDRKLILRGVQRNVADIDQIVAERQMRSVLFEDPEGQQTSLLRLLDGQFKIACRQFVPLCGKGFDRKVKSLRITALPGISSSLFPRSHSFPILPRRTVREALGSTNVVCEPPLTIVATGGPSGSA